MNLRLAIYAVAALMLVFSWVGACVVWQAAEMGDRVAPLDPRGFERLTLVAVGTGGVHEDPERRGPAIALGLGERVVLVDAGRGVADALRAAGIPVSQPDTLLLTNLLPENTIGLDELWLTGWWVGREQPLRVIGPPGTRALVEALQRAQRVGIEGGEAALALPNEGARLEAIEADDGWSEEADGLRLRAAEIPGGPVPAIAWRVESGGRAVVVSGTGWAGDELVTLADEADVLVHEAVYVPTLEDAEAAGVELDEQRLRSEAALRSSILDVGALAQRAGVDTLALVRLRPPPFFTWQFTQLVGQSFDGRVWLPEDGDELTP